MESKPQSLRAPFILVKRESKDAIKDARKEPLNATTITKGTIHIGQKRYCLACCGNHVNVEFVFALKMLKYLLPMRNSVAFRLLALLYNEKLKFTMTKGHSHE